jgi:hypothetical protein
VYAIARGETVHELIRRARRRFLNQELMSQGAITFSSGLAAFIVLLLLGTEVLNWYWAALIPLAAIGTGIYRAYRRRPSSYRAAQIVDHRMALADTLSTAVYFSGQLDVQQDAHPDAQEVVRSQREIAERAATGVDLRRAIPYSLPRSAYIVAALALVASSLFALRYGLNKRLDLRAPLARMVQEQFSPRDRKETADNMRRIPQPYDNPDDAADAAADQDQKGPGQQNADSPDAGQQGDQQDAEKSGASKDDGKKQSGDPQSQDDAQNQQADDQDQQDSGQANSSSQGQDKSNQDKQADGKQQSNNASESGSLMSKLKDFAENLLSKVKPQPQNGPTPPQQSANQNSKQGSGQQNGKQQQSKEGQQNGSQQADEQQGQNGDAQKDGQDSQGKGSGQDKSQQATKQPGSGVGSEDGSKEIRQAEQLAAMGKISELIGKRSAAVTGEATVEVQTTSQQLHTAYVKSGAEHSQAGAEIDRDEIPVALQPYVQQYFDQLRKQPAAAVVKKQ